MGIRELIIDFYEAKSKQRSMYMFPELYRGLKDICKNKGMEVCKKEDVKNTVNEMIINGELEYWSSGSTTYIKLGKPLDELKKTQSLESKLDPKKD